MKPLLCPVLSLVVFSGLLFGNTESISATNNNTNSTISLMTTVLPSSAFFNSIYANTSHSVNSSVHGHSTLYMNLSSVVILTTSHSNASTHNSTVHPTLSPSPTASLNHSIFYNTSSVVSQNVSHMTSHIIPTHSISPSAMTSILPTTTVAPTPPPFPNGHYSIKKNGKKCLIFWLSFEFTVTYKNSSGEKINKKVVMPVSGKAEGSCEEYSSSIRISWSFYSVEVYFQTAKSSHGHWNTANITITIQVTNNTDFNIPNVTQIQQSVENQDQLEWLSGDVGNSLNCSKTKTITLKNITATIKNARVQPFEVKDSHFSKAEWCDPVPSNKKSKSNNTVAIAVGCSLGGLVLIVLIGYFIGKRRSRSSTGYRKL